MHIDQQLLEDCFRGNERAQYELYEKCYGILLSVCKRFAKDGDEEGVLLNTGFLKILNGLESYKSNVPFEAWIRRIMINTIIDDHRKNKKYKETIEYRETIVEPKSGGMEYNQADLQFDAEQLLQFVRSLPPMSAKVFNLFAIDGYTHKEISGMLGISEGTSKWHLNNARSKLKDMIENEMNVGAHLKTVTAGKSRFLDK